jgi:glycosyltransferase involved in cell wall biosynthesis
MTILRAADHLRVHHDVEQGFVICGDGEADAIRAALSDRFESLRSADVIVLGDTRDSEGVPPADFSIATHWTTAYDVLRAPDTATRFYFIQDWEPGFYPAGTIALQAEATYRFGLFGICNTEFLRDKYAGEYGVPAMGFTPCVDADVFHPPARDERSGGGKMRLFFYGRPEHARNCFELTAEALRRTKRRFGDRLEIVSAGADWKPRSHGLDGVVENLGILRYAETGELYRTCHIGVSLMATLHPSYIPIELMACGVLAVSNHNNATRWALEHKRNCLLAHGTPGCLSETLSDAISGFDQFGEVRAGGLAAVAARHSDWSAEMEKVAAFVLGAGA